MTQAQVSSRLRKAKFIAIPLDGSGTGPSESQTQRTEKVTVWQFLATAQSENTNVSSLCKAQLSGPLAYFLGTKGAPAANVHVLANAIFAC